MNYFVYSNFGKIFIFIYLDQIRGWFGQDSNLSYIFISATLLTARPHSCTWYVLVSNDISFALLYEQKVPHL